MLPMINYKFKHYFSFTVTLAYFSFSKAASLEVMKPGTGPDQG